MDGSLSRKWTAPVLTGGPWFKVVGWIGGVSLPRLGLMVPGSSGVNGESPVELLMLSLYCVLGLVLTVLDCSLVDIVGL